MPFRVPDFAAQSHKKEPPDIGPAAPIEIPSQKVKRIPNSTTRGAPSPKTPVPCPTRKSLALVVLLMEPAPAFNQPVMVPGGKSKLAKLNTLKKPTLGSSVSFSWNVCVQLNLKSNARNHLNGAWSTAAAVRVGAKPPSANS